MASQVGEAVIKLTFDGKNVNAQLSKVESEVEKTGKKTGSAWGSSWAIAAGNLIARGVSKVASMVTDTMGKAIGRLDTLNNFPRVMESLGYSADEANTSVTRISDALDGLPTSLDAMVADTQKLAASLGNLAQGEVNATSLGLGLNDMLLAGGKGTEAASAAMEQYNQMLARGKVDMQSWVSLINAAPGQMDQLAKSILGANANQAQLYQAMQEGTVSFDQLNAAIVQLDQQGGQGFASFYDQAVAATGGVATQLENVGNTMNKILAAALEGNLADMDKYINQLGERIGAVAPTLIQGFAGGFSALMQALPGIITQILPSAIQGMITLFQGMIEAIPMFVQMLVDATPMIMDGMIQMLNGLIEALPVIIPALIQGLVDLITTLAMQLTRPDFLTMILQAGVTLLLELVKAIPKMLVALVEALPQIIENIISWLTDPNTIKMLFEAAVQLFLALVMAIPQIIGAIFEALGKLFSDIFSFFGDAFSGITEFFQSTVQAQMEFLEPFFSWIGEVVGGIFGFIGEVIGGIADLIGGVVEFIGGIIGGITEFFQSTVQGQMEFLTGAFTAIGDFIGGIVNGIASAFQGAVDFITGIFSGLFDFFNSIFTTIGDFFAGVGQAIGDTVGGAFMAVVNAVLGFVEGIINGPIDVINGFLDIINGAFGWLGVNIGHIDHVNLPRMAEGGVADSATAAIFGEAGTEVVLPLQQNTDNWSGLLASALAEKMDEQGVGGRGITVYMENKIDSRLDAEDIGRVMVQSIRRAA